MLKRIFTWKFWDKALTRALRTAIQVILAAVSTCAVLQEVNIPLLLSEAVLTVVYSILTSVVAGLPEISDDDFAGDN